MYCKQNPPIDHRRRRGRSPESRGGRTRRRRGTPCTRRSCICRSMRRNENHETKTSSACMCVLAPPTTCSMSLFIYLGCHERALTREELKGGAGAMTAASSSPSSSTTRRRWRPGGALGRAARRGASWRSPITAGRTVLCFLGPRAKHTIKTQINLYR